jgi:hypothetical protein
MASTTATAAERMEVATTEKLEVANHERSEDAPTESLETATTERLKAATMDMLESPTTDWLEAATVERQETATNPLEPVVNVGPSAKRKAAVDSLLIYSGRSANPPSIPVEAESGMVESVHGSKGFGFIR